MQGAGHPHPGVRFSGTQRIAYLPDSAEGRQVLSLLKVCFERRHTFAVGRSLTTGVDNVITWGTVHHKTNTSGGEGAHPSDPFITLHARFFLTIIILYTIFLIFSLHLHFNVYCH